MTVRQYDFIVGPETATLPTQTTPTESTSSTNVNNAGLAATAAANALTVALKTGAGSDPSSGSSVTLSFRTATLATGTYTRISISAATSVVIPNGATLGHANSKDQYIYVYCINNAGAVELMVSSSILDENQLHTTTAIDTNSDSATGKYSTSARSNVAIKFLGRILNNQSVAGTYASSSTEISLISSAPPPATSILNGVVTSFSPIARNSYGEKSASYTGQTTDGYRTVAFTTGGTNRTYTPPSAADNIGRKITLIKVDTGAAYLLVDLAVDYKIFQAGVSLDIESDGTNWNIAGGKTCGMWEAYTPSIGSCGTVSTLNAYWRQNDAQIEVYGSFTTGTTAGTAFGWQTPNSFPVYDPNIGAPYYAGFLTQNTTTSRNNLILHSTNSDTEVKLGDTLQDGSKNPLATANGNILANATRTIGRFSYRAQ